MRRTTMQNADCVERSSEWLRTRLPKGFTPQIALVLGTGLGGMAASVHELAAFAYGEIPGFPTPSVESHQGRVSACRFSGRDTLLFAGRPHLYEGRTEAEVCQAVRVSKSLGASTLVITNASGALNPLFSAGDLMLITDHINLTGRNPLIGPNVDGWGPRFPDMSRVYSPRLAALALAKATELSLRLERGVYAGVLGPSLETPAETRFLRNAGADAVGMSTVMEVIAAKHLGMEILGLSCLVNQNLPDCMAEVSLEEILAVAEKAGEKLGRLVEAVLGEI